jgi:hypothetical protein
MRAILGILALCVALHSSCFGRELRMRHTSRAGGGGGHVHVQRLGGLRAVPRALLNHHHAGQST